METKICKQCERELLKNTDFFFKKKDTKDGYVNKCKEYQGYSFTNKLTKIPKDGYRFCIKCDRELRSTSSYFPVDRSCKDGLRNVCRECGKDGHFMEEDYVPKQWWSDEENQRFIELYPHYTNKELIEIHYPDETEKGLWDRAYKLGVEKSEETRDRRYLIHSEIMFGVDSPLYGIVRSEETRQKISEARKGKYVGENSYWFGRQRSLDQRIYTSKILKERGQWKGENNPRHKDPLAGERNGNWQGGITELYAFLRNNISEWKQESIKQSNYKCILSGKAFDDIHHLYSFDFIVQDTLSELNLPIHRHINDYTKDELSDIIKVCQRLHMDNIGVCLTRGIHKLFHDTYGYGNNTPEQFEEFRVNYIKGKYDMEVVV